MVASTYDPDSSGSASSSFGQSSSSDGNLSLLEQTLWKNLNSGKDPSERFSAWLSLLANSIENVSSGVIVLKENGSDSFAPIALWPMDTSPSNELSEAAEKSLETNRGIVLPRTSVAGKIADLAYPVTVEGNLYGVVAITVSQTNHNSLKQAFREMQWGVAWIREYLTLGELTNVRHLRDKAVTALKLFAVTLEERKLNAAAMAFVTNLAETFRCERVSLGFVKRGQVDMAVISQTAQFSKQMNLVRLIEGAMDEAVDQRAVITYPPLKEDPVVCRAHEELSRRHRSTAILTLPLFVSDQFIGALTFERTDEEDAFTSAEQNVLNYVAACIAPILLDKKKNDRWLIMKAADSLGDILKVIFGAGNFGRKLILLAILATVIFFYFATTRYDITADAKIEGSVQRSITAPFDGFILDAPVRPGDLLEKDSLIVSLDDRDMVLERLKWVTERNRQKHLFDKALSERDRAEVKIAKTKIDQAEAQIELVNEQLRRAKLIAPFSGMVVSGDLSQRIGAAVRKGDALIEIAPLDAYRVILYVDESQINDVERGQLGELVISSLPDLKYSFRVVKITPVAQPLDGRTAFVVEAALIEVSDRLRPGMIGVGKINIDERPLVWVWARPMIQWFKLFFWRWIP